jgi:hypothetical protein
MAKFDNEKAIELQKELREEHRPLHRRDSRATSFRNLAQDLGIVDDAYGTDDSDTAQYAEQKARSKAYKEGDDYTTGYLKGRQAGSEAADEQRREANRGLGRMKKGGKVKSASARADGCAIRGKTRA